MGRHRPTFTPDDRLSSVYQYLPIEVPPGTRALTVEVDYDRTRAVIDLGLFDSEGFRGWSGGARTRFDITPVWATPGYLPGDLPAGEWRVVLGLYVVPDNGVTVDVEWRFDDAADPPEPPVLPPPQRPPPRQIPAAPGRRWLACDFHAHSVHSDGELEIVELASLAAARGLDLLAVTDHNTVSHHPHLAPAAAHSGITLLPGQEVTTDTGHANCLGDTGWIDFREPPDHWLAAATAAGGLLSINHPLAGHCAWLRADLPGVPLIEAWHWTWDRVSTEPLDWWRQRGGTPVGGSDFHRPSDVALPGSPTTWVETDGDDVLAGLAAGRVAISAERDGPVVVPHEGSILVLDGEGCRLTGPDGATTPIVSDSQTVTGHPGLHLLIDPDGVVQALTP